MKKWMTLTLALCSLLALTACGSSGGSQTEPKNVDLTEVYASMEEVCDWWSDGYMEDIPEEMLELYYPSRRKSGSPPAARRSWPGGA